MDFSETIEIKVVDKEDNCVDSYFFAYFHNIGIAVDQIRRAVESAKGRPEVAALDIVKDTTSHRVLVPTAHHEQPTVSMSPPSTSTLTAVRDKLATPVRFLRKPASDSVRPTATTTESAPTVASPLPLSVSPQSTFHTYPPSLVHHSQSQPSEGSGKTTWTVPVGVPSWLKNPSKYFFSSSPESTPTSLPGVAEEDDANGSRQSTEESNFGFAMVDGLDTSALDPATVDKFRAAFAFDERETLLAGQ